MSAKKKRTLIIMSAPVEPKTPRCTKCNSYYHDEGIECGYRFCPICGRKYSKVYVKKLLAFYDYSWGLEIGK